METGTKLGPAPESLFRPVKRRKFLRRRPDHEREDSQEDAQGINDENASTHTPQETDDTVRVRRPQRTRKGGIEFSTTSRQATDNANQAVATPPTAEEAEDERVRAMCDRFTAHTGQTVDIDKHMYGPLPLQVLFLMRVSKWKTNKIRMNYIETEMAKRHRREMPVDTSDLKNPNRNEAVSGGPSTTDSNFARREPATLGKLHEIDLGQETKLRNIARTEAATRRLAGDDTAPVEEETATEKTAVEKEGKPWRNRKSQNSKDVERDRLVEEVLRESKLDIYDEPDDEPQVDDQAADDRIAEQFRRDFMDAIQSRRRVARNTKNNNTKTTKTEAPRGPKLGGSRSARAAMRESQKTQK